MVAWTFSPVRAMAFQAHTTGPIRSIVTVRDTRIAGSPITEWTMGIRGAMTAGEGMQSLLLEVGPSGQAEGVGKQRYVGSTTK